MIKLLMIILLIAANQAFAKVEEAIFAAGSFWRAEEAFSQVRGVLATVAGFDGGTIKNPSIKNMLNGKTDYLAAIRVIYNSDQLSYQQLVDFFWHHIDPGTENAQFCDEGPQFNTAIFYLNEQQKEIALASKTAVEKIFKPVYTKIAPSTQFYAANEDNQGYFENHPFYYNLYYYRCGHEQRLQELWQNK